MEDKTLIERFKQGAEDAFEVIVRRYESKVYNVAYNMMGDADESEDIVQEVFIKAYDKLYSFRGKSSLYTWLYRITVNTVLDHEKKRKTKLVASIEEISETLEAESGSSPYNRAEAKELQRLVRSAINTLPPKYRMVIVLRELSGLSYAEIAEVLNCSQGTVESRLNRARAKLKDKFIRMGLS